MRDAHLTGVLVGHGCQGTHAAERDDHAEHEQQQYEEDDQSRATARRLVFAAANAGLDEGAGQFATGRVTTREFFLVGYNLAGVLLVNNKDLIEPQMCTK